MWGIQISIYSDEPVYIYICRGKLYIDRQTETIKNVLGKNREINVNLEITRDR